MHLSKTAHITVVLCLVVTLGSLALSQDDQQKNGNRNNLLLRRGNVGRQNPLAKTTTTTPPPEYAEDEYVDEDGERYEGEEEEGGAPARPASTTTTTTTESPKKIRPSVRPFRSNDDLLSALKKRRQEYQSHKPAPVQKDRSYDDEDIPAPAPAKAAKTPVTGKIADNVVFALTKLPKGRRFGPARKESEQNASPSEQNEQQNNGASENAGAKSLTSRLGRSRFALKQ
ncbi:uncharacterized protein LOC129754601 isoform X1 [Uranotaenia lowii]|uniref:uncharacterized protein LOC129754601 isoform X1 n=1 Tax=Uranotaenia lowii TaxID=190385 RepID=UPI002478584D|nr:uncharacterized protein LOC129754601 isoform X1 [Uranotaenia lowii]XP_055606736.1 uncharacterized protein LOC129754601 isoform X1 [Uranotaenia lowii]XP_055606745.1 uncharacterized protein LOC129754601 isoform X1 [Uranotaenia lowii]XP_055606754.1 uncharacterized protein LOC129754601 isoform X1 [Uranotaenia lowii]